MNQDMRQHGLVYNVIGNLPIVGPSSKFLMDYMKLGIAEFGYFLGILRGGFVGMVMFSIMLFLSEAIPLGWTIIRNYFDMIYVQPVMAGQRSEISDLDINNREDILGNLNFVWLDPGQYLLRPKHTEPAPASRSGEKPKLEEKASSSCAGMPVQGCFWLHSSRYDKLRFILGVHDGVAGDAALWNEMFRKEWSFEEHIQKLDTFYSVGANASVPVIVAMKEVRSH